MAGIGSNSENNFLDRCTEADSSRRTKQVAGAISVGCAMHFESAFNPDNDGGQHTLDLTLVRIILLLHFLKHRDENNIRVIPILNGVF